MAVAKHFGDEVTTYSIWNEPNHPEFLRPQYARRHRPASPRIYRSLYFAAMRGFADGRLARSRCSSARRRRAAPARSWRR